MSAAAADSLWTQVISHRPSDVTDLRKRISSHVSVLHISGELSDQFFMEVHRRSSTQQFSPTPLCINKNVTWLCDSAGSLSLCHMIGLGPTAFRELGFSHWGLHSSCEDETCTKHLRACWLWKLDTHGCSPWKARGSVKCSWGVVQRCELCCPELL